MFDKKEIILNDKNQEKIIKQENSVYKKKRLIYNLKIFFMLIFILPFISFELLFIYSLYKGKSIEDIFKNENSQLNQIALVNIDKQITYDYIEQIIDLMEKIRVSDNVKNVVISINSPGGSPAASEELSNYLNYFQKNKKVYGYIEDIAASGGYYVASAIKNLYANPNAIIGSIGVLMPKYNVSELANKIGVKEEHITAGKHKIPISWFKDTTKEQKDYLMDRILNPAYQNFIKTVAKNRNKDIEIINKVAEGQIFIANDERVNGLLIDNISTKNQLIRKIKEENDEELEIKLWSLDKDKKFNLPLNINLKNIKLNLNQELLN